MYRLAAVRLQDVHRIMARTDSLCDAESLMNFRRPSQCPSFATVIAYLGDNVVNCARRARMAPPVTFG